VITSEPIFPGEKKNGLTEDSASPSKLALLLNTKSLNCSCGAREEQ